MEPGETPADKVSGKQTGRVGDRRALVCRAEWHPRAQLPCQPPLSFRQSLRIDAIRPAMDDQPNRTIGKVNPGYR